MRTQLMKHGIELKIGSKIKGKWHKNKYKVRRKLGAGTVGTVYLCESNGRLVALKISQQEASIITEVNVLKELQKVQGENLGPSLFDVDDLVVNNCEVYSFYVMEYLQGDHVSSFINSHGYEWVGVFLLQILGDLTKLHQEGWVFGDLKIENLLILQSSTRIRWIDVGGTTQIGRAIKEHTDFFDRGYWGMGTRKAEPSYDLFALAMVCLAMFYPNYFPKTRQAEQTLVNKVNGISMPKEFKQCLKKAILGKYSSSGEMKNELLTILAENNKIHQTGSSPSIIEVGGILALAGFYYISSIYLL